jgi:glycosyltransferase involved in cell wall biosynthesis
VTIEVKELIELTICIPTYNPNLDYLESLLESIRLEENSNIRCLVSDDQSGNAPQIEILVNKYSPVQFVQNRKLAGIAGNWNNLLANVETEFMLIVGQDDLVVSKNLAKVIEIMTKQQSDLIFCAQSNIDEKGYHRKSPSKLGKRTISTSRDFIVILKPYGIFLSICIGNVFPDICSTIIKTSSLRKVGRFNSNYLHALDLEMWIRIFKNDLSVHLTKIEIGQKRIHPEAATAVHVKERISNSDRHLLYNEYSDLLLNRFQVRVANGRLHVHDFDHSAFAAKRLIFAFRFFRYLLGKPITSLNYIFTSYVLRYTRVEGIVQSIFLRSRWMQN